MFRKLSSARGSRLIQTFYEVLAMVFAVAWLALIGFLMIQEAYQVGGLLIIFTVAIIGLAIANERPD